LKAWQPTCRLGYQVTNQPKLIVEIKFTGTADRSIDAVEWIAFQLFPLMNIDSPLCFAMTVVSSQLLDESQGENFR
jgi:hypothetical protein